MNRFALLALVFVSSLALAQSPQRIRGTITSLSGDSLMVKTREGRDVTLQLAPDAQVVTPKKGTAADFKPGSYVGVTSTKNADGRLVAQRVHALGPQVPQMHGAWDSIPNSMMTNANIESSAQVTGGNELTLKYKDGEQKILVTPQTEYYTFENGSRADLKPGETIFAGARMDNDGKLVALRVAVSKNGVKPPQ